ncbi:uncharacterized protein LOC125656956 isoform X2 [Ostrea edulis]|uniref:uncharacterized protein LOC125656956 isoform X2 n=1 Tax=Ostrea edulis TaxID=37623 RepID=UPI0024AF2804|nr:uncharacterized protein LOC125656956 isoform X2 [Ostrea edulis]
MASRVRSSKFRTKPPRISGVGGSLPLGIQQLSVSRPRTAQFEAMVTPRSLKEIDKPVKLPACRRTSGIMDTNKNHAKALELIDCEEELILPDFPASRPVTAPGPAAGGWTRMFMSTSQRDDFEMPDLEDLRLGIPDTVSKAWEDIAEEDEEIRIIMIGKSNSGKSATANTILGYTAFNSPSNPLTKKCRYGTCERFDRRLVVVDTPDICDKGNQTELLKAVALTSPGPHVFIFVVGIGLVNTDDEHTYSNMVQTFGNEVPHHTIILFTRKDDLIYEGMTIFGYVNEVPEKIKDALTACNRRYIAFDNNCSGRESEVQVRKLLDIIDNILVLNRTHFSNIFFDQIESHLEKRSQNITKAFEIKYKEKVRNMENDLAKTNEDDIFETNKDIHVHILTAHQQKENKPNPNRRKLFSDSDVMLSPRQRPNSSSNRNKLKLKRKSLSYRKKTARTPSLSPIESVDCDSESELIDAGNLDYEISQYEIKLNGLKEELERETEKHQLREKVRMELVHDVDEIYKPLLKTDLTLSDASKQNMKKI